MRLSIVTSVLDGEPYIGEMLTTVPRLDGIEHLVIDAGSTDGTIERLRQLAGVRLVESPGASLYQAWNQAIDLATGDALLFLNADDRLAPGGVATVLEALEAHAELDVAAGGATAFASGIEQVMRYPSPSTGFDLVELSFGAPVINARIFRRRLFDRFGRFDGRYRLAADREFLLRLALSPMPPRCQPVAVDLYRYRIHEGSKTLAFSWNRRVAMAREHAMIAAALIDAGDLAPDTTAILSAWRAREMLAQTAGEMAQVHVLSAMPPLAALLRGLPGAVPALSRARRLRRRWIDRLQQAT